MSRSKMKILEAQSAQLTNYEVYLHLTELQEKSKGRRGADRPPGNLETVRNEVCVQNAYTVYSFRSSKVCQILDYLKEAPSPLGSEPFPYDENTIKNLLIRLREFQLTKAETIMILNLRPTKPENLNTVLEEMEERFDDHQQLAIVAAIADVLGKPDGVAERQAMTDNKEARKEQSDLESKQDEAMAVDYKSV